MSKSVHELLLESPDASILTLQSAWKAVAAGDWLEASKQLGYAAEHGDTAWHEDCQILSDSLRTKARDV